MAIDFKTGKSRNFSLTSESMIKVWVSPNTADAGDTVVIPTINNRTVRVLACTKNGTQVAAPIDSNNIVTLESGGSATSQTYVLTYIYE